MANLHFITGATGWVGGAMAARLLYQTSDPLLCATRGGDPARARTRVLTRIEAAARALHLTLPPDSFSRVQTANWEAISSGVEPLPAISTVWHASGLIEHREEFQEDVRVANVESTRRILEIATRQGARALNFISDAAVAVDLSDTVGEEPLTQRPSPASPYEASKFEAESLLSKAASDLTLRVFRCGVLFDASTSLTSPRHQADGIDLLVREITTLKTLMANQHMGTFLQHRPIRVRVHPDATIDLLSLDVASAMIVAIASKADASGIFHVTNHTAPNALAVLGGVCRAHGLRAPSPISDERSFTTLDRYLDGAWRRYAAYWRKPKRFDQGNVTSVLGAPISQKIDVAFLGGSRDPGSSPAAKLICSSTLEVSNARR